MDERDEQLKEFACFVFVFVQFRPLKYQIGDSQQNSWHFTYSVFHNSLPICSCECQDNIREGEKNAWSFMRKKIIFV